MQSMRKSLLIAALGACLPMFMSDAQASGAPTPESPNDAGGASREQSPGATSANDASDSGNAGETGNADAALSLQSMSMAAPVTGLSGESVVSTDEAGNALTPVGSSTGAELSADGTTLVPNAPVSDAETQSAQSTGGIAADASGATDVATLDADAARHPAHTWLDLLEAELKTNPFATYARELVAKVRAVL